MTDGLILCRWHARTPVTHRCLVHDTDWVDVQGFSAKSLPVLLVFTCSPLSATQETY